MDSRVTRLPLVAFLLSLALVTGCIFSPERKPPTVSKPPSYKIAVTPQDALENLTTAYMARDSVATDSLYHPLYRGYGVVDPSQPLPLGYFTRDDEIRHVGRLKLDPNIVSVFLDLGSPVSWQVLDGNASDPPGWKVIQLTSQTIRIEDISRFVTWESKNQIIEYTFAPTPVPGAPADRDTTWKVVRWTEN